MKKLYFFIGLLVVLLLGVVGFIFILKENPDAVTKKSEKVSSVVDKKEEKSENKPVVKKATIAAIGDILLHGAVLEDAKSNGQYNFDKQFAEIKTMLGKPDFLIANQESIPGGKEVGISAYPVFNSPHEIVDANKKVGIDLLTFANNHAFDRREAAVLSATSYCQKVGMPYVGAYASQKDHDTLRIFDVNGIKLGVIAYTYGTNGIDVPSYKKYLVNVIDKEKMSAEIERMKPKVDVVAAAIHWGTEYQREPNDSQKELAQFLADQGVHIIFGSHPHVLQPIEWITGTNGQKTLCVYSLGNFISNQRKSNVGTLYSELGGMAQVTVTKTTTGEDSTLELSDVQFKPTYVAMNSAHRSIKVVPMEDAPAFGRSTPTNDEMIDFMIGDLEE